MYDLVSEFEQIDREQWCNFLDRHPNANIFHSIEMAELYKRSPNHEPLMIACLNEARQIVGILTAKVLTNYSGIVSKFTSRAIIWGGPLVFEQNREIISVMLAELDKKCKKKAIYSQFRNLTDLNRVKTAFIQNGYAFDDHLDVHIDLTKGEDTLWHEIHPTRRKQILRGYRRGTQVQLVEKLQEADLQACYGILNQVYKEAKLPHPEFQFFLNAMEVFRKQDYLKAFLAFSAGKIIGFRFMLCYKGVLYDWYAGSLKEYYQSYPNDILPWEALKWGIKNGCKLFDFGGAGKPNVPYGVRDYKLRFGGQIVNFGRFEKIHHPIQLNIAKIGFKAWRLLKH